MRCSKEKLQIPSIHTGVKYLHLYFLFQVPNTTCRVYRCFSLLASDDLKAFFAVAKSGDIRLIKVGIENGISL